MSELAPIDLGPYDFTIRPSEDTPGGSVVTITCDGKIIRVQLVRIASPDDNGPVGWALGWITATREYNRWLEENVDYERGDA